MCDSIGIMTMNACGESGGVLLDERCVSVMGKENRAKCLDSHEHTQTRPAQHTLTCTAQHTLAYLLISEDIHKHTHTYSLTCKHSLTHTCSHMHTHTP